MLGAVAVPATSLAALDYWSNRRRLIFILAGQSNMSGRGKLAGLPKFKNRDRIRVYSNAGTWVPGHEPVDDATGQIDMVSADKDAGVGPGMAFADRMADLLPNVEIGLVPCAKGSTVIDDWHPSTSRATLYGSMIARAKEASRSGEIAGMLWYQGEKDSNDPVLTREWSDRFRSLIENVRSDLAAPDLPVVMTVLGPNMWPERYLGWDKFVEMQEQMPLPRDVGRISAQDLAGVYHHPHLTTASYIKLGHRFADAMYSLMYPHASERPVLRADEN